MAGVRPDEPLLPSVLDRLLDPGDDLRRTHGQSLAELRSAVRRDLEGLLNTPQCCRSWPAELTELNRSLISYGIPDMAGIPVASAVQREGFRRMIEEVIRTHEPRFKTVTVTLLDASPGMASSGMASSGLASSGLERMLRFRIDALMYAEPAPEPVAFDSQLDPATRKCTIRNQNRG